VSTELTLLAWCLVLAVVQVLMPSILRIQETGPEYNASPRDVPSPKPEGVVTGRLRRAQANLFETLPLFGLALLIAHAAASRLTRLYFAFGVSADLGFDFFLRLQLRSAERAKEQRMVNQRSLVSLLSNEPDGHVNDFVRSDREARLEIAAFKSFLQLFAAGSERLPGFRHNFSHGNKDVRRAPVLAVSDQPMRGLALADEESVKTNKQKDHEDEKVPRDPKHAAIEANMLIEIGWAFVKRRSFMIGLAS
jgi:MAPEG family